jgi:hypothetical protein
LESAPYIYTPDLVSRLLILALWIISILTRVWYETAKGLCFSEQERKMDRKEELADGRKAPASNFADRRYGISRLPGQLFFFTVPCFRSMCIADGIRVLRDNQILADSPKNNIGLVLSFTGLPETRRV